MAGQPQVREAAWLHRPGDEIPLVHVRLEERPDGGGWDIWLADPSSGPSQHAWYASEAEARAQLAEVYEAGRVDGEWRITRR